MIYIDASAIVAMITGEAEAHDFIRIVAGGEACITCAVGVYEATLAVARKALIEVDVAAKRVASFLDEFSIDTAAIGHAEQVAALEAFARYGKPHGKAKLNMGDCFAYACAKTNDAALLYKGDDFALTDIRAAA